MEMFHRVQGIGCEILLEHLVIIFFFQLKKITIKANQRK